MRTGLSVRDVVLTGRTSVLETWFQTFTQADRDDADARLAQMGCLHMAERPLSTCSQGERARVYLARALFGRRELLLFDEPAAGLDLPAREQLVTAMESAGAEGITSVLATHHLEEIPPGTTHAALLAGGHDHRRRPYRHRADRRAAERCVRHRGRGRTQERTLDGVRLGPLIPGRHTRPCGGGRWYVPALVDLLARPRSATRAVALSWRAWCCSRPSRPLPDPPSSRCFLPAPDPAVPSGGWPSGSASTGSSARGS